MVKENIIDYKNALETRVRTFKESSRVGRRVFSLGLILALIDMAIYIPLSLFTQVLIASGILFLGFGAGVLLMFVGNHLIASKGVPRTTRLYLSPDEQIFLKIFDALTFLEAHVKRKLEPAKYQCVKELREAHELMEELWVPNRIEVIMKEIGNELVAFKEKFSENLIYSLEHATKVEIVSSTYDVLTEFGEYFIDPSKEKLVELNKKMDSLLHSEIARPRYPIVDFLMRRRVHHHAITVGLIFLAGFLPAFLGHCYGHISTDSAYVVFATIFGPLIAVYLTYVLIYGKRSGIKSID